MPAYGQVVYRDVWPGIDLVFQGDQQTLKYAFHVKPGADPSQIALRWRGTDGVRIATDGSLAVATSAGTLRDADPVAWQDGVERPAAGARELAGVGHDGHVRAGRPRGRPAEAEAAPLRSVSRSTSSRTFGGGALLSQP